MMSHAAFPTNGASLSPGEIAGIVIGSVVLLIVLVLIVTVVIVW